MSESWRIEMLGGLRVLAPGASGAQALVKFPRHKAGSLLGYLAYHADRSHARENVAEMLWPDMAPRQGRVQLRVALSEVGTTQERLFAGGPRLILSAQMQLRFNSECAQTDVREFEAALVAAKGAATLSARALSLCRAVDLYQGELLRGYEESWIASEAQRLEDAFFDAVRQLLRLLESSGDGDRALRYAHHAVHADPLREEWHYELIRLYMAQGQPDTALAHFRRLENILVRNFQREPEDETRQLVATLLPLRRSGERQRSTRSGHATAVSTKDTHTTGTNAPGTNAPGTNAPGTNAPGTNAPGTNAPGTNAPGLSTVASLNAVGHSTSGANGHGAPQQDISASMNTSPPPTRAAIPTKPQTWPGGAVTFLLLDNLLAERGTEDQSATLCRAELRELIAQHGGREVGALRGDSMWALFRSASDALACALAMRHAIGKTARMAACCGAARIALDTGDSGLWTFAAQNGTATEHAEAAIERATLDRALEVLGAAHPEQTLCSEVTGALLRRELKEGVTLDDLGVYRLRDAALPERLYQVSYPGMTRRAFPAPNAAPLHSGELPLRITTFFGREEELAQVIEWLTPVFSPQAPSGSEKTPFAWQAPPCAAFRMVTLTGFGGCGKTRLAIESARRLRTAYAGAVWFVPLANVRQPQLIAHAIMEALHLPGAPGLEPWRQVVSALGEKPSLLVLDNFEQLSASSVSVVHQLLTEAPCLTLLVTSRRRLGVSGERDLSVRPLPLPPRFISKSAEAEGFDGDELLWSQVTGNPGVQIFEDRARNAHSEFRLTLQNIEAVARLCRLLEGVPLALELAAAHVRTLTPGQMLELIESRLGGERLELLHSTHDDMPDRHRTLRAAIEWSFELLDPPLRRVFTWLSVFRGGWTLAAAGAITAAATRHEALNLEPVDFALDDEEGEALALDNVMRLQDASLVHTEEQATQMRFSMLEMLRQFAAEQLGDAEREQLHERHAAYFAELAERASAQLMDAGRDEWLRRLDPEIDNLRAALHWYLEHEPARCLQMAGALWRFWEARGHFAEGRDWLERALARTGDRRHEMRGAAHDLSEWHATRPAPATFGSPSLPLSLPLYLRALNGAARLAWYRADFKAARRYLGESLSLARAAGDAANPDNRRGIANALHSLGLVAMCQGDASARAMLEEGLNLVREQGDRRVIKDFMLGLALVRFYLAESGVRELLQEALTISRELGDRRGIAFSLNNLGMVEGMDKNFSLAREYHEQSLPLLRAMGDQWSTARALSGLGRAAWFENDIEAARSYYRENLQILRDLGSRWELVYSFEGFAWLALRENDPHRAALILGAAEAVREATNHILFPVARPCYEECLTLTRQALAALGDPVAAAAAWRTGRNLSREAAIAEALKK